MVGHQQIGVYRQPLFSGCLTQAFQVVAVVFLRREDGLAVIAALDRVYGLSGQEQPG